MIYFRQCWIFKHHFLIVSVSSQNSISMSHGPLARYVKLWVAHAPGMPGTFPPPPRFSDPDMHHDTCVTHVSWCMPGSLTSDFLWSRWRGKRCRHSRRMRKPQFYVSAKRPIVQWISGNVGCLFCWMYLVWLGTAPFGIQCKQIYR